MTDLTHLVTDPTALTTAQLLREIAGLQELMENKFKAVDATAAQRLEMILKVPVDTEKQVQHLREVHDERFMSVAKQFEERDVRGQQATSAGAEALAAALQAAKELVGSQAESQAAAAVKTETSFTKQIDQIGTIIQTLEKALDARLTELKERIDRGEGNRIGLQESRADSRDVEVDQRAGRVLLVSVIGTGIVLFSVLLTTLGLVLSR